ncbi:Hypothetical predicted protein [Cloeon dipterum]|uniref:Uncharacterized protein n=1 Tax=Cloeon dipterum TaxID=197152 RepID=A0A8S1DDT7_9INSE|nr:Hypothetical predicted protein [Cloeon dipterum]
MSGPQEKGRWAPSKRGGICSDDIGDDVAASGGGGMSRLFTCARKGACIARPAAKTADSEDERGTNAASQPSSLSFLTDKLGNSTAATASNLRSFISNRLPSTLPDTGA